MTGLQKLPKFLLGSRKNLLSACKELDIDEIPDELPVMQCMNCSIWVKVWKDDELCPLCADLDNIRI